VSSSLDVALVAKVITENNNDTEHHRRNEPDLASFPCRYGRE
jgi:hypothetical protein